MIFSRRLVLFLFLFGSILKGFSIEPANTVGSDSTVVSGNNRVSICNDSVFSFHSKKGFVPSLIHNFGEQAVAPFHMNAKQTRIVAGGIAITGALFFADENIDKIFKPLKANHAWIDKTSSQITEFGSNYGIGLVAAFGCYSLVFNNRKAFRSTLLATQAVITSGIWVRVGKILTGRERPSATYGDFHHDFWWGPFQQFNARVSKNRGVASFDAFPSGHTATAFSIASVFAHQYADKKFVPIFAYTLATLVGVSRLTEHEHWASDVFAGACIGYLCGKQVVKHERELESTSSHASNKKIRSSYFLSLSENTPMLNCFFLF